MVLIKAPSVLCEILMSEDNKDVYMAHKILDTKYKEAKKAKQVITIDPFNDKTPFYGN